MTVHYIEWEDDDFDVHKESFVRRSMRDDRMRELIINDDMTVIGIYSTYGESSEGQDGVRGYGWLHPSP